MAGRAGRVRSVADGLETAPEVQRGRDVGRSRGGLSTKIHHLCDGQMRPLVILLGPGQGGDSPMFIPLMQALRVDRTGPGRPRTRPAQVLGDKAYSSRANRE